MRSTVISPPRNLPQREAVIPFAWRRSLRRLMAYEKIVDARLPRPRPSPPAPRLPAGVALPPLSPDRLPRFQREGSVVVV